MKIYSFTLLALLIIGSKAANPANIDTTIVGQTVDDSNSNAPSFGYSPCQGFTPTVYQIVKASIDPSYPVNGDKVFAKVTIKALDTFYIPYWVAKTYFDGVPLFTTKLKIERSYEAGKTYNEEQNLSLDTIPIHPPGKYSAKLHMIKQDGQEIACYDIWVILHKKV